MNNKWYLLLVGILLSAMVLVGCNSAEEPLPPANDNDVINNDNGNIDNNGLNEGEDPNNDDMLPGVDVDDNLLKDDEADTDPDPEDPIEDVEDMVDENRKDQ